MQYFVGSHTDITHHKQLEQALADSEARYRRIADAAYDWEFFRDAQLQVLYTSPACERLVGVAPDDFRSGLITFEDLLLPDDRERVARHFTEAQANPLGARGTFRLRHQNGRLMTVEAASKPVFTVQGLFNGLRTTLRDVTESYRLQTELERQKERYLEAETIAHHGYLEYVQGAQSMEWSEETFRLLGYDPAFIKPSFRRLLDRMHPDDRSAATAAFRTSFESAAASELEFRVVLPYTRIRTIQARWRSDFGTGRDPQRTFGILRDITELKEAEERIHRQNLELKKLNEARDRLYTVIAHDLRLPFNTVLGFTELLRAGGPALSPDEAKESLDFIQGAASEALNLLDRLLSWLRAQKGELRGRLEGLEVRPLAQEILNLHTATARLKGLSLANDIPGDLWVQADPVMLVTIFRNLADNALKYTPRGGAVRFFADTPADGQVRLGVANTGPGLEAETLARLKNPQAAPTSSELGRGPGLGLVICRDFLAFHDSVLEVESPPGQGAVFSFVLSAAVPRRET